MGYIENDAPNNSFVVACEFVATETFLLSHCLATELLPSSGSGDTRTASQGK
jgi:hypothetical protein